MMCQPDKQLHTTVDELVDLQLGLLGVEESERILEHLAACPSCEESLRETYADRQRLIASRELHRDAHGVAAVAPRSDAPLPAKARIVRFRSVAIPLTAAASLFLMLWLWPHDDPGTSRWLPSPSAVLQVRSGAADAEPPDLAAGLRAYDARDLEEAISTLSLAEGTGPLEDVRRVYLGSALVRTGRNDEAVAVLSGVATRTLPDPWGSESRWNLYLALAGCGRAASADSLLGELAREQTTIGRRARQEIRRLIDMER